MESKFENQLVRSLRFALALLACLGFLGLRSAAAQSPGPDAGAPAPAPASAATLSQAFNPPEAPEVGERLVLKLDVTHPLNTTVHLPEAFPNPRWELTDREQLSIPGEAHITTRVTLTFQIFRPGATTLPGFEVTVLQADGSLETLTTEPIQTQIFSVLPTGETPELTPARAPVAVWVDDYTLLWAGAGLLALLIAGGAGFFISRRNRPEPPPPPPRPAHLVALEKLSALTPGDLLDRGEYMLFYVRMSEAIREYLGRRYGFPGTELTTTEILNHLTTVEAREGWPKGIAYSDVRDWLNYCDLIKFSDLVPERERSEQLLRQAFSTVELTHLRAPDAHNADTTNATTPPAAAPQDESMTPDAAQTSPYAPTPGSAQPEREGDKDALEQEEDALRDKDKDTLEEVAKTDAPEDSP